MKYTKDHRDDIQGKAMSRRYSMAQVNETPLLRWMLQALYFY